MTRIPTSAPNGDTWQIPDLYHTMNNADKALTVRSCILNFLEHAGGATMSQIITAIGATSDDAVRRQVHNLASTQQIYYEPLSRDPIYFRNGKMAHPLLQANIEGNLADYSVRTYSDPRTGKYLILTEYSTTPLGEKKLKGGVRIPVADLQVVIDELKRIQDHVREDRSLLDDRLVGRIGVSRVTE